MKPMKALLFGVLSLLFVAGCAGKPIINYESMAVPQSKSQKDVQKIVREAATASGWQVKDEEKGKTVLALFVRSHMAKVAVIYDKNKYTLRYLDSTNLSFSPSGNTIHGNYNKWVNTLNTNIQKRL